MIKGLATAINLKTIRSRITAPSQKYRRIKDINLCEMHLANKTEIHTRGLGNNSQGIGTLDGKLTVFLRQIKNFTGKLS